MSEPPQDPTPQAIRPDVVSVAPSAMSPAMPPAMPDLADLLGQAMQMQEQMLAAQTAAHQQTVTGVAGGGVVRIEATGAGEFRAVHIAAVAVDPNDVAMLEDLVLAALHDVSAAISELSKQAISGLDLGALGGLLGPS